VDPMLRIDPAEPPGGRARRMARMTVDRMPAFWPVTLASGPAGPAGGSLGPVCPGWHAWAGQSVRPAAASSDSGCCRR
jgi:hypothetical protein